MAHFGVEEIKYPNEIHLLNKFAQFYREHGLNSLDGRRLKAVSIELDTAGVDAGRA